MKDKSKTIQTKNAIPKLNLKTVPHQIATSTSARQTTTKKQNVNLTNTSLTARDKGDDDQIHYLTNDFKSINSETSRNKVRVNETVKDSFEDCNKEISLPPEDEYEYCELSHQQLTTYREKNLQLLPEYDSLSHKSDSLENTLDTSHKKLGDQYILILLRGLQPDKDIQHVNFRDGRITDDGFVEIFQHLSTTFFCKNIKSLDISENSIRRKGSEELCTFITNHKDLQVFKMENMLISDTIIRKIVSVVENSNITGLYLSQNKIGDSGASAIAALLSSPNTTLTDLDLSWNDICHAGGRALAIAVGHNSKLKTLDLSWNALGSSLDKERTVATHLSEMFKKNATLTHLSLSQNQFSVEDCQDLAKGLSLNGCLLGLHIDGNGGKVDAYGHLCPDSEPWPLESAHSFTRIVGSAQITQRERWTRRSNCWICGRFREVRFSYALSDEDILNLMRRAVRQEQDCERERNDVVVAAAALADSSVIGGPGAPAAFMRSHVSMIDTAKSLNLLPALSNYQKQQDKKLSLANRSPALLEDDKKAPIVRQRDQLLPLMVGPPVPMPPREARPLTFRPSFCPPSVLAAAASEPAVRRTMDDAARLLLHKILSTASVQISTSFDRWAPQTMDRMADSEDTLGQQILELYSLGGEMVARPRFELYRLVPPGKQSFYFVINGVIAAYDEQADSEDWAPPPSAAAPMQASDIHTPTRINYLTVLPSDDLKAYGLSLPDGPPRHNGHNVLSILPRMAPLQLQAVDSLANAAEKSDIWLSRDSLFHVHIASSLNQRLLLLCFEQDMAYSKWANCKIDRKTLKDVIWNYFELINDVFVHQACIFNFEHSPSFMTFASLNELVLTCKILDTHVVSVLPSQTGGGAGGSQGSPSTQQDALPTNEEGVPYDPYFNGVEGTHPTPSHPFTRGEINVIFLSNCQSGPSHDLNSKRDLCRFQFIDTLVSIAVAKYRVSPAAATEQLMHQNLFAYAERDRSNEFRSFYLITEETDTLLREHYGTLMKLYSLYSKSKISPAPDSTHEEPLLSLNSFRSIFTAASERTSSSIPDRYIKLSFYRTKAATAPCVDFFSGLEDYQKLSFLEFLEATVKLAHMMAMNEEVNRDQKIKQLIPVNNKNEGIESYGTVVPLAAVVKQLKDILGNFNLYIERYLLENSKIKHKKIKQ